MLYATEAAAGAVHSLRRPVLHAQGAIKCPRNPHVAVALCSLALNMVALDSPATCLLCALALWAPLALQGLRGGDTCVSVYRVVSMYRCIALYHCIAI